MLKDQYPDCLLFFRLGDFYELFLEDAIVGAEIMGITLTARPRGRDGDIPMAGVPFHAVDSYLAKLVKKGKRVAICEQISEPNGKGIVERDVVRIVTPGTVLNEISLDQKENNYVVSIFIEKNTLGLTACDITTGDFQVGQWEFSDLNQLLSEKLALFNPSECILSPDLYNNPEILKALSLQNNCNIYCYHEWKTSSTNPSKTLKKHFKLKTFKWLSDSNNDTSLTSASALLKYLESTQKTSLTHIKTIKPILTDDHVVLDKSTLINLELLSTMRDKNNKHSLIYLLDKTKTPMGGRLIRQWLTQPLTNKSQIEQRLSAITELLKNYDAIIDLRELLREVSDIERITSRITLNLGNPRDLIRLKQSISACEETIHRLSTFKQSLLKTPAKKLTKKLISLKKLIDLTIIDQPPVDPRNGGIIKTGIDKSLDKIRKDIASSKDWMNEFEQQEKKRTGISTLKLGFNRVFGFYIEISKSNLSKTPNGYERKQTLVNAERFITPELKVHEEIILTAQEKTNAVELKIFRETISKVIKNTKELQDLSYSIAQVDCLINLSYVAEQHNYCLPEITTNGKIEITAGRHPVVETLLEPGSFVPNDIYIDTKKDQLMLITGPNMAGKSVFMRQVAIITLLSHIGSYVPAQKASISLTDRIFVRSGATDAITSGLSTFMVEMVETAHILHHATNRSLIILDEIGRGTSTYDGISLAFAVAEYLVSNNKIQAKTLFATHYHELQTLEDKYPKKIKNYQVAISNNTGTPIFLHTVIPGKSSHSHGITVANLAGIPKEVIDNAQGILQNLEQQDNQTQSVMNNSIISSKNDDNSSVVDINIEENKLAKKNKKYQPQPHYTTTSFART